MAETAFQIAYRQEFIAAFEQRQSLLRDSTTTEAVIKGNQATFLVAGSGGASAVSRGVNGLIPARADSLTQNTATLVEWHDLVRKTNFNVMNSQGNQREIMQGTSMNVINRKIDADILGELANATVTLGTAAQGSLSMVMRAKTKLGNAGVPWDSNLWAVISPAFEGYLMQLKEFSSREYLNKSPPVDGADAAWRDKAISYFWLGVNWIVHPNVAGVGTSSETCFMYHKSSIGNAINTGTIEAEADYDREQAYSWARTTVHVGSKIQQNSGIVIMPHDGSALA